jgi:GT2 family glycosyltransferase
MVFVWDNSPEAVDEDEQVWLRNSFPHCMYHSASQNIPLAQIYNYVIRTYFQSGDYTNDWLLLLDQDSSFDCNLFLTAEEAARAHPTVRLLLPMVRSVGIYISPARLFYFKGLLYKKMPRGLIYSKYKTACNSGMFIGREFLRSFAGYDPRLRFYGTDNFFVREYARSEPSIVVLEAVIDHDLSRNNKNEPRNLRLWRHRDSMLGIRLTNQQPALLRWIALIYCTMYSLRKAFRHRDSGYLRWK